MSGNDIRENDKDLRRQTTEVSYQGDFRGLLLLLLIRIQILGWLLGMDMTMAMLRSKILDTRQEPCILIDLQLFLFF